MVQGLLFRFHRFNRNRWGDVRDREGAVLLTVNTVVLLGLVALAIGYRPESMAAWGPGVFAAAVQVGVFLLKIMLLVFGFVWLRWTLPRFRYDQLMDMGWKNLIPLSLINILITGLLILWIGGS